MNREAIMLALFAQLQNAAVFKETGRRVRHWSKVAEQPALFLRHTRDHYPPRATGIPAKPTLHAEAWIYSRAGKNPDAVPESAINHLIDAVEAVLAPVAVFNGVSVQNTQTLGGAVEHCWIEGAVEIDTGDLDAQAKAIVPIALLIAE